MGPGSGAGRPDGWYSPPGSDCRAKRGRTKKSVGTVRGRNHGRTRPASGTGAGTRSSGWHQRSRHPAHGPHGAAPYPGPDARRHPAPDNRTAGPDNLCSTAPRLRPGENPAPWRPGRPHHPPRRHRQCPTSRASQALQQGPGRRDGALGPQRRDGGLKAAAAAPGQTDAVPACGFEKSLPAPLTGKRTGSFSTGSRIRKNFRESRGKADTVALTDTVGGGGLPAVDPHPPFFQQAPTAAQAGHRLTQGFQYHGQGRVQPLAARAASAT